MAASLRPVCASLVTGVAIFIAPASGEIYRWDTGELIRGTEGITPEAGVWLAGAKLEFADLSQADLAMATLAHATLASADLSQANLAGASFFRATFSGANLSDAMVTGASFEETTSRGFTPEQLYSTASYKNGDLSGIGLGRNDLSVWNFIGQNLAGANFHSATLTSAELADAVVTGASFGDTTSRGFTRDQLYATASYVTGDLTGIGLTLNDLSSWNFAGQNLTGARFYRAALTRADLSRADLTGASFYRTTLTGADLTDALVAGASFEETTSRGFTPEQLYSTASFQIKDLSGIGLARNDLSGWNLGGQNLTGADFAEAHLTGADLSQADLAGVNFDGATLTNINLSQVNLARVDLRRAALSGAILSRANLVGTDLEDATLTSADLSQADLAAADFKRAILTNANLSQADLTLVHFHGATLAGADLSDAVITGTYFEDVTAGGFTAQQLYSTADYKNGDLSGIRLRRNDLSGWNFAGQNLTRADFSHATLTGAVLSDADLSDVNLTDATLANADLSHANLTGADFRRAVLTGADLSHANLIEADFGLAMLSGADLSDAVITGASFEGTTWSPEQLYSTADYKNKDLSGIRLQGNDLTGWNFAGQNLARANFSDATLTSTDLSRANLTGVVFRRALLTSADLSHADLTGANVSDAMLTSTDLRQADLTGADFGRAILTNADLSDAVVTGTSFEGTTSGGFSPEQLYSTASYKKRDLSEIRLAGNELSGWDFAGQKLAGADFLGATLTSTDLSHADLTGAVFDGAMLTDADLSDAVVTGASFAFTTFNGGFTAEQLYSTASYKNKDLSGTRWDRNDLSGWDVAGQKLAGADLSGAILRDADLTGADLRGARYSDLTRAITRNLITRGGAVFGLELRDGEDLWIRDHDSRGIITVFDGMSVSEGGVLRLVFEADHWNSLILFEQGIPVRLDGTLELTFARDVDVAAQVGRTLSIFNWTVDPNGAFDVTSPYRWDLSRLYTTGEVRLIGVPEPNTLAMVGFAALVLTFRTVPFRLRYWNRRKPRRRRAPSSVVAVTSCSSIGLGVWSAACALGTPTVLADESVNYTPLVINGRPENRVDVVVIGDGYTSEQLPAEYRTHLNGLVDYLFGPLEGGLLARYRNFFNVHEVAVASNESGADAHRFNGPFRDTALGAAYHYDGLNPQNLDINSREADRVAAQAMPQEVWNDADLRIALVNDTFYGGTGGTWATYPAGNPSALRIAIHEVGHAFAGLADEYFTVGTTYTGAEPQEPNVTTGTDKWDHWQGYVDPDHPQLGPVDYYEGGKYHQFGIYRPTQTSRMLDIRQPWNAVSREAIIEAIYREVRPLDDWPASGEILVNPPNLWVEAVDANVFAFEWSIDGARVSGAAGEVLDLSALRQSPGDHTVSIRVYDRVLDHAFTGDSLDWWRKDDTNLLQQEIEWNIRSTLAGDYNGDGLVEQGDLDLVLSHWGQPASAAPSGWVEDLPVGVISQTHLDQVLLNWGRTSGTMTAALAAAASIPEPGTAALLAVALCVLGCRGNRICSNP
jgi:uncharacterized protein YjbI with pentapeptide repeats